MRRLPDGNALNITASVKYFDLALIDKPLENAEAAIDYFTNARPVPEYVEAVKAFDAALKKLIATMAR